MSLTLKESVSLSVSVQQRSIYNRKIAKYHSALLSIAKRCKALFPILILKHDVVGGSKHAKWQLRGKVSM
jgi:hypothetical protein